MATHNDYTTFAVNTSNSEGTIVLLDKRSSKEVVIKVDKNVNDIKHDINLIFEPTNEPLMSKKRLETYINQLKEFIGSTTPDINKIITPPSILDFKRTGDREYTCTLSPFESAIFLPRASVQVQVATDEAFNNIVTWDANYFGVAQEFIGDTVVYRNCVLNSEEHDTYYVRARYGGGGYYSSFGPVYTYKIINDGVHAVLHDVLDTDIEYTIKSPYYVNLNFSYDAVSPSETITVAPKGGIWKIYEIKSGNRVDVISKDTRADNNGKVTFYNAFPVSLELNVEYFIELTPFISVNDGPAEEYPKVTKPFKLDKIKLAPLEAINIFPNIVSTSSPIMNCNSKLYGYINGTKVDFTPSDITTITWVVQAINTGSETPDIKKFSNPSFTVKLPTACLKANTEYIISVSYTHNTLGNSPSISKRIKTTPKLNADRDGLPVPLRVDDKIAYFGDISPDKLMSNDVWYRGVYDNKKHYLLHDEVTVNGELYIAKNSTPTTEYSFLDYFVKADTTETNRIYKSGLPTYEWLAKNIGLNPYLDYNHQGTEGQVQSNVINSKNGGWIKCQNAIGKIIYISKFPMYANCSVNDLIKTGIFHPRRKTVRLADKLYYIRLLVSNLNIGYDCIDPAKKNCNINFDYNSKIVEYKEEDIITALLNGRLAAFGTTDLDINSIENKELVYDSKKLVAFKSESSGAVTYAGREIDNPDERTYVLRAVLELIPEEEKPIYNISKRIPGNVINNSKDGFVSTYDPYLDYCYLGSVSAENFLTSASAVEKSNLIKIINRGKEVIDASKYIVVPNLQWHKIYYRGLIYFLSQGCNVKSIVPSEVVSKTTITSPTPTFVMNDGNIKSNDINIFKIVFNNVIYSLTLPQIFTMQEQHQLVKTDTGKVDIVSPGTENAELDIAYDTFFSDAVYPIIFNHEATHDYPAFPNPKAKGFKGAYKDSDNTLRMIPNLKNSQNDRHGYILTSSTLRPFVLEDTVANPIAVVNSMDDPYVFRKHDDPEVTVITDTGINYHVDLLFCLTVNPTIDATWLWDGSEKK